MLDTTPPESSNSSSRSTPKHHQANLRPVNVPSISVSTTYSTALLTSLHLLNSTVCFKINNNYLAIMVTYMQMKCRGCYLFSLAEFILIEEVFPVFRIWVNSLVLQILCVHI